MMMKKSINGDNGEEQLRKNRGRGRRTMIIEKKDTEKNTAKTKEQQRTKKKDK